MPGVKNVSDDILVYGKTQMEHDNSLRTVLKRLIESGLTLNKAKCELNKSELEFFGHVFSANGVCIDPKRIEAINKMEPPKNAAETKSYLGRAQFLARYINNFSSLFEPLRVLTKAHEPFRWGQREQQSFDAIKDNMCKNIITAYFSPTKPTTIIIDGSKSGLAAILAQPSGRRDEMHVISYASRSVTPSESRYSQIELEALASVYLRTFPSIYLRRRF